MGCEGGLPIPGKFTTFYETVTTWNRGGAKSWRPPIYYTCKGKAAISSIRPDDAGLDLYCDLRMEEDPWSKGYLVASWPPKNTSLTVSDVPFHKHLPLNDKVQADWELGKSSKERRYTLLVYPRSSTYMEAGLIPAVTPSQTTGSSDWMSVGEDVLTVEFKGERMEIAFQVSDASKLSAYTEGDWSKPRPLLQMVAVYLPEERYPCCHPGFKQENRLVASDGTMHKVDEKAIAYICGNKKLPWRIQNISTAGTVTMMIPERRAFGMQGIERPEAYPVRPDGIFMYPQAATGVIDANYQHEITALADVPTIFTTRVFYNMEWIRAGAEGDCGSEDEPRKGFRSPKYPAADREVS